MSEAPAQKPLRWYDAITINVYFFALTLRSQALSPLIVPLLVQQFVGDASKGSSYGSMRLVSLMVALLVQAVAGQLSDNNTSRWGRRRPFLLVSTLLEIGAFLALGWIAGRMDGTSGYWALFAVMVCSMAFSNIGHGAAQGLIPGSMDFPDFCRIGWLGVADRLAPFARPRHKTTPLVRGRLRPVLGGAQHERAHPAVKTL